MTRWYLMSVKTTHEKEQPLQQIARKMDMHMQKNEPGLFTLCTNINVKVLKIK